jgi:hypothetical protein
LGFIDVKANHFWNDCDVWHIHTQNIHVVPPVVGWIGYGVHCLIICECVVQVAGSLRLNSIKWINEWSGV